MPDTHGSRVAVELRFGSQLADALATFSTRMLPVVERFSAALEKLPVTLTSGNSSSILPLLPLTERDGNQTREYDQMPRRRIVQLCECGCGEMTNSGRFLRGHHTRRRWQLIKAVASEVEARTISQVGGQHMGADVAGAELASRGWNIPDSYRHFGVELEVIAPDMADIDHALRRARVSAGFGGYHARGGVGQWMITGDSSVQPTPAQIQRGMTRGYELVSPPLRGRKGIAQLRRVMTELAAAGIEVNKSCGAHVHHCARDFSVATFARLAGNYANLQSAVDTVMPNSRRATVGFGNNYCRPIDGYSLRELGRASTLSDVQIAHRNRYSVVNFQSFPSYGTVELRQHAGTVNADKLIHWILFGQGMMRAAVRGVTILPTGTLAAAFAAIGGAPDSVRYFERRASQLAAA